MSLLKRLNAETAAPSATPPAARPMTGAVGGSTGSISSTSELIGRQSMPSTASISNTSELFSPPVQKTPPASADGGGRQRVGANNKADSFNELKARVQNRLISELDPRMDLGNADEVRRPEPGSARGSRAPVPGMARHPREARIVPRSRDFH